jgi:S-methylmethionine-dependent homocysteine/selenocysteine methylase
MAVLKSLTSAPVGGYANAECVVPDDGRAGTADDPESAQRNAATVLNPEAYALEVQRWLDAGATIVGGCCGTRPKHIRRLREMLGP